MEIFYLTAQSTGIEHILQQGKLPNQKQNKRFSKLLAHYWYATSLDFSANFTS